MPLIKPDGISIKHAGENLNIGFALDGLEAGETIMGVVTAATPEGLMLNGNPLIDGNEISARVTGGSPGTNYRIRFAAATNMNVYILDYIVKVIP